MIHLLTMPTQRIGHPALGIVIPAIVFAVSFLVAYLLYRHFSKELDKDK